MDNVGPQTTNSNQLSAPNERARKWRNIASNVALLVIAPLISLLLTFFIFQSYQVDGMSMETTLQNQDRLIVWKASQSLAHITDRDSIPNRYDIIVFTKDNVPGKASTNGKVQLIKRVVGLPGERVVVGEGRVTIYNAEHPDGFSPDSGQSYAANQPQTPGDVDVVVPPGHVFVLGDNRSNSYDSPDFGPIPASDIVGKLVLRITPLDHAQAF